MKDAPSGRAQSARLDDGRWHLQHGPIDLVIEADGSESEVNQAYSRARERFDSVLDELVRELGTLREPLGAERPEVAGPVALRMVDAAWPHRDELVTPMIAVAGAVADEVLGAMIDKGTLRRAYVNNGGDIAVHLTPGACFRVGLVSEVERATMAGCVRIEFANPVRGIATSGWRGRSFSFGIADAVTVLGVNAAAADVSATLIANAVNADNDLAVSRRADDPVRRTPANAVADWTDLGGRPVTVAVGALPCAIVERSLDAGAVRAAAAFASGEVTAAALFLQGASRIVGPGAAALALEDGANPGLPARQVRLLGGVHNASN
ncbi:MAG: UPF0280 family protein [Gammaproteobacteria bacterium]